LTAGLFPGEAEPRALAELLLERQGIVTRDGVRGEGVPGGYAPVYRELRKLETLGVCRRGYFVEGLGGAQFALLERSSVCRFARRERRAVLAPPAQPCAPSPWPAGRLPRASSAPVVLLDGEAVLCRARRALLPPLRHENAALRQALVAQARWAGRAATVEPSTASWWPVRRAAISPTPDHPDALAVPRPAGRASAVRPMRG
jgi:ATP-dependent Lhr-like helicase